MFWKERWLRPVEGPGDASTVDTAAFEAWLSGLAVASDEMGTVFRCQITQLREATSPLSRWNVLQYVEDLWSGNVSLGEFLRIVAIGIFNRLQILRDGATYPRVEPRLRGRTPSRRLDLQAGERVRIRSKSEIEQTLNENGRNRGLWFDHEQVDYCGTTQRVAARVQRILDERTGRMVELPNECIRLEGVVCRARYSSGRLMCPRAIPSYWREIWLERVDESS
jgi:hypothetical protein